jgi:hypothetical protein
MVTSTKLVDTQLKALQAMYSPGSSANWHHRDLINAVTEELERRKTVPTVKI